MKPEFDGFFFYSKSIFKWLEYSFHHLTFLFIHCKSCAQKCPVRYHLIFSMVDDITEIGHKTYLLLISQQKHETENKILIKI